MRLILVDGKHSCYRAYFTTELSTSYGEKVGVVYNVLKQISSVIERFSHEPFEIVIAWDSGGSKYRSKIYPEYKANRAKIKAEQNFDNLAFESQVQRLQYIFWLLGIRQLKINDIEADDLIGISIDLLSEKYDQISVITGDHDLWQLIDEKVSVFDAINNKIVDELEVKNRLSISPRLIPAWKALVGDTADNIPGVPGIGEKIASALLLRAGSLKSIYEELEQNKIAFKEAGLGPKKTESVLASKELVKTFLQLTAIMSWGDLDESERITLWNQLVNDKPETNFPQFRTELEKLEFKSLTEDYKFISTFERYFQSNIFKDRPDSKYLPVITNTQNLVNVVQGKPACYDLVNNCPNCQESVHANVPDLNTWEQACTIGQAWRNQGWVPHTGINAEVLKKELDTYGKNGDSDKFLKLRNEVYSCNKCALRQECKAPVFSQGMPTSSVMIIARNPGKTEDGNGIPLSGKAGIRFNKFLAGQDGSGNQISMPDGTQLKEIIKREQCYITNTAKCYSLDDRPPEENEIYTCSPYLREEIKIVHPKIILTMGAEAMTSITGISDSITKQASSVILGKDCNGIVQYTLNSGEKTWDPVIPEDCVVIIANHPSHALRVQTGEFLFVETTKVFANEIKKLFIL